MVEQKKQRLFFALWPKPEQRRELQRCFPRLTDCPGQPVVARNLHLTLAFPGTVDAATRACLEDAADAIHLPPFIIGLNRFGYWKHPKVVWYGPTEVPEPLILLAKTLEVAVRSCGLESDPRPYRPHVTLLRKARRMPDAQAPEMIWHADGFALVLSESHQRGIRYRVLRNWELKS
ncbi:RNA 2',3'-cyclic phosphodiesterase [Sedimenticola sp.]|uniref:RNA 2',3'-cyclic phosphodiesterase n=1 Tax=Sedimenticola sp. TaxID=1940285 RepID=UPI003D0EF94F